MNVEKVRKDFPFLEDVIIYFDNASTSQKPQQVLDALTQFYSKYYANVARGVYQRAEQATHAYEQARLKVATFIGAQPHELVFTKGTTEGINLVATAWGENNIGAGDEIIITQLEHHSNMVPWQQLAHRKGAHLKYIPVNPDGTLQLESLDTLLSSKTKLIAFCQTSNALGVALPVRQLVQAARSVGALVLVDAAQSIAHQPINVHDMQVDFLAFSGHKMFGPTGIGGLYIKKGIAEQMRPYQFGGGMIYEVDFNKAEFLAMPHMFEAGTPPIAQAIGLGAAVDYINTQIDFKQLALHEAALCAMLIDGLAQFKQIRLLGPLEQLKQKGHMVSFTVTGFHAHDVATYLSNHGICVRAGNHCAQPLAKKLGIDASIRASFYAYNTRAEVEKMIQALATLFS